MGKKIAKRSSKLILTPGLQSGVERLAEMPMLINGALPTTSLVFVGADASAAGWAERGGAGTLALQAGTAPSYGQESPLAGSGDACIKGNGGGYFAHTGADLGNITTEDIVMEAVLGLRSTSTAENLFGKYSSTGYGAWVTASNNITLGIKSSAFVVVAEAITPGSIYHALCFLDRSGSGILYLNKLAGTAVNISAQAATISTADTLQMFAFDNASPSNSRIYYTAIHTGASGWLDSHLQPALVAQRYAALIGSKPSRSIYDIKYPETSGCTSSAYQTKLLADGYSQLFQMGAGTPRFEIGVDANGEKYCGAVIEGAVTNLCLQSNDLSSASWVKDRTTAPATSVVCPDGITRTTVTLHEDATAASTHLMRQSLSCAAAVYSPAFIVKAAQRTWCSIGFDGSNAYFDLANGVVGTVEAAFTKADIAALGNGWYLIWAVRSISVAAVKAYAIYGCPSDNVVSFDGLDQDSIYVCHAQLALGSHPLEPVATTTAAVTKPADQQYYAITEGQEIGVGRGATYIKTVGPIFTPGAHILLELNDGSTKRILVYVSGTTILCAIRGTATNGDITVATNIADNVTHELLVTWQDSKFCCCLDGVLATIDTAVTVPTGLNRAYVGSSGSPTFHAAPFRIIKVSLYNRPMRWEDLSE